MTRMRSLTLLFGFATLLLPVNSVAQASSTDDASRSGSICVLPNSPKPPTQISPGGMYNPDTLTVHLDNRDGVRWPHKTPVLIESLGLEAKHLVVLTSDGKPIQSVRFKFSDYHDAKLCIISMATKGCSWAIGMTLYGARRRAEPAGNRDSSRA